MIVDQQINILKLTLSAGLMSINQDELTVHASKLLKTIDKTWLIEHQDQVLRSVHNSRMMSFMDRLLPFIEDCRLSKFVELYNALIAVTAIRRSLLEPVFAALAERHIDVMPYKGIDFFYNYKCSAPHRFFSDIDLIIKREQLVGAAAVFNRLGFVQGDIRKDRLSVDGRSLSMRPWPSLDAQGLAWVEQSLKPFVIVNKAEQLRPHEKILAEYTVIFQSGHPMVVAYIDLEWSVLPGIAERDVWRRTRVAKVGDGTYSGLCPELYLCSLFNRVFADSSAFEAAVVYPFTDAVRLVVAGGLDWDYLWELAQRYFLVMVVSEGLLEVAAIAPSAVPAEVVQRCHVHQQKHRSSYESAPLKGLRFINSAFLIGT
ncbi:nucleotidyltransferase family protein [Pseudomonas sp. NPDC087803]|uniref:nucleotidyltransferase family protein n=1 Tax=Pseudomonas sp. NPDC087803 TaxID=3364448 RepID=UPI0038032B8A